MSHIELCRGKPHNDMGRIDKTKQVVDGGNVLNRIQLLQTGNSKKIWWIDGYKSDSPHLVAGFLDIDRELGCGLISLKLFKTFEVLI
jgi:hypothetical protein